MGPAQKDMFESLSTRLQDVFKSPVVKQDSPRRRSTRRFARSGWRSSRRTSTPCRQGVRRARARQGGRRRRHREPDAGTAGRSHRPGRNARLVRRDARWAISDDAIAASRVGWPSGFGKTTSSAKLAKWLRKRAATRWLCRPTRRPAAIKQLSVLGEQVGFGRPGRRNESVERAAYRAK
jgi:hypothetical protein